MKKYKKFFSAVLSVTVAISSFTVFNITASVIEPSLEIDRLTANINNSTTESAITLKPTNLGIGAIDVSAIPTEMVVGEVIVSSDGSYSVEAFDNYKDSVKYKVITLLNSDNNNYAFTGMAEDIYIETEEVEGAEYFVTFDNLSLIINEGKNENYNASRSLFRVNKGTTANVTVVGDNILKYHNLQTPQLFYEQDYPNVNSESSEILNSDGNIVKGSLGFINKFSAPLNVKEGGNLHITSDSTGSLKVLGYREVDNENYRANFQAAEIGANSMETYGNITISGGDISIDDTFFQNMRHIDSAFIGGSQYDYSYREDSPLNDSGTITINGGSITAKFGEHLNPRSHHGAAVIGGGTFNGAIGNITINGGTINVSGDVSASGGATIGGGSNNGTIGNITINGGNITAVSNGSGAAIGGGSNNGSIGNITINDGTINATGVNGSAIGSGAYSGSIENGIVINKGNITAVSNGDGAAIGLGIHSATIPIIDINGGTINATSEMYASAIGTSGNSEEGAGDILKIEIDNADVTALVKKERSTAIGASDGSFVGEISITNSKVIANEDYVDGYAIGASMGYGGVREINILDSDIIANGKVAIGSGQAYLGGYESPFVIYTPIIKITNSNVTATGEQGYAAIGGGYGLQFEDTILNDIIITNSIINATATVGGAAIGASYDVNPISLDQGIRDIYASYGLDYNNPNPDNEIVQMFKFYGIDSLKSVKDDGYTISISGESKITANGGIGEGLLKAKVWEYDSNWNYEERINEFKTNQYIDISSDSSILSFASNDKNLVYNPNEDKLRNYAIGRNTGTKLNYLSYILNVYEAIEVHDYENCEKTLCALHSPLLIGVENSFGVIESDPRENQENKLRVAPESINITAEHDSFAFNIGVGNEIILTYEKDGDKSALVVVEENSTVYPLYTGNLYGVDTDFATVLSIGYMPPKINEVTFNDRKITGTTEYVNTTDTNNKVHLSIFNKDNIEVFKGESVLDDEGNWEVALPHDFTLPMEHEVQAYVSGDEKHDGAKAYYSPKYNSDVPTIGSQSGVGVIYDVDTKIVGKTSSSDTEVFVMLPNDTTTYKATVANDFDENEMYTWTFELPSGYVLPVGEFVTVWQKEANKLVGDKVEKEIIPALISEKPTVNQLMKDEANPAIKFVSGYGVPGATVKIVIKSGEMEIFADETKVDEKEEWLINLPEEILISVGDIVYVVQDEKEYYKLKSEEVNVVVGGIENIKSVVAVINNAYTGDKTIGGFGVPGATLKIKVLSNGVETINETVVLDNVERNRTSINSIVWGIDLPEGVVLSLNDEIHVVQNEKEYYKLDSDNNILKVIDLQSEKSIEPIINATYAGARSISGFGVSEATIYVKVSSNGKEIFNEIVTVEKSLENLDNTSINNVRWTVNLPLDVSLSENDMITAIQNEKSIIKIDSEATNRLVRAIVAPPVGGGDPEDEDDEGDSDPTDGGNGTDSGDPTDGGNGTDGGDPTDGGNETDGGDPTDGGNGTDSGNPTDGGNGTDSGDPTDGGNGNNNGFTIPGGGSDDDLRDVADLPDEVTVQLGDDGLIYFFDENMIPFGTMTVEEYYNGDFENLIPFGSGNFDLIDKVKSQAKVKVNPKTDNNKTIPVGGGVLIVASLFAIVMKRKKDKKSY